MRSVIFAVATLVAGQAMAGTPNQSTKAGGWRLGEASSPYLRQHADNPVAWYAWGDNAFERARKENKPIYLSVGYSSCYWCHVMERESFDNEAVAKDLNANFISVKVDRERRPDVDATYMLATELLSRRSGWPNSVFLTPDLKPFFAFSYVPPEQFKGIVEQVANAWKNERTALTADADRIANFIAQISNRKRAADPLTPKTLRRATLAMLSGFDALNGGIGTAPKFPREPVLSFLLSRAERDGNLMALDALELTLENIIRGGINDHLAGGFHRYATDNEWAVPHFEKMLYNQALLGRLLTRTYVLTGKEIYANAARKTYDFVIRDMITSDGGFASAFDAEADGEEGLYYLWTKKETDALLGSDAEFAAKVFGLSEEGNIEGRNTLRLTAPISQLSKQIGSDAKTLSSKIDAVFSKLRKARDARPALRRDDKLVADWNAAMIRSLAEAAGPLSKPEYLEAALRAMRLMRDKLGVGSAKMKRVFFEGTANLPASLSDHAQSGLALVELFDATGDEAWLELAKKTGVILIEQFADKQSGDFFLTLDPTGFVRTKQYDDGDLPAANAATLEFFALLARRDTDPKWQHTADGHLAATSGVAKRAPSAMAATLAAADLHQRGDADWTQSLGKGAVRASVSRDGASIVVHLKLRPGWHVNARNPSDDFFIPTTLKVAGLEPKGLTYPEPAVRKLAFHDKPLKLYEYEAVLEFTLPSDCQDGELVNRNWVPKTLSLSLQACSDKICLEPETAVMVIPARNRSAAN